MGGRSTRRQTLQALVERAGNAETVKPRHGSDGDAASAASFNPSESGAETEASASPYEAEEFEDDDYEAEELEDEDGEHSFVSHSSGPRRKTRQTRSVARNKHSAMARRSKRLADDSDDEYGPKRTLRKRASRPNYQLPPMDISAEIAEADVIPNNVRGGARAVSAFTPSRFGGLSRTKDLPWPMPDKDLVQAMGDPDTSDSDDLLPPMKNATAGPSTHNRTGVVQGPSDVPNFGRVNPKSSMADADPLGVDVNVTFDRVGGLDDHINQLKEMVALPLLYPELFQQFGIIPPRGVLFHGPPGTGKTLLARALAASCSNGNTKIAFFMRKGADVLSKWVGEAERQLRMLFEEARASQPSIIFFDEIDGLAPVRSSKQDQIHASLVSTLLALMDGMDGRGQVIVIGATNRPDAVDPALRRPGRFDREFYFPLPNRTARRKIIGINTREWDPPLPSDMMDMLATLTKGYGGADLRALCTEAALNAIQRRYPQIYKTADRLQVEAGSVHVQPKDFMMAVKKIVPSSARSAASAAIPLPTQLVPLLTDSLDALKAAIDRALPPDKKRTALEEAEFEDEDGDTFEKEMMLQSLDKLRIYRPRVLVYGTSGAGQTYLGPAILHHLEGFHVQSFDLATLMGDSTRTPEAAIVQLFVEAKRHQPSIIYIPSLAEWAATLSESARSTVRVLLDGIPPSDPVLLLAIVDGPLRLLPHDVRSWFGYGDENRIKLGSSSPGQREVFFASLIEALQRSPIDFPDGVPRKRRILEILPPAPPLPPRQPTEAELARESERDRAARDMLFVSFSSLVSEFMKKYRRPVALIKGDAFAHAPSAGDQATLQENPPMTPTPQGHQSVDGTVIALGAVEVDAIGELDNADIVVSTAGATDLPIDISVPSNTAPTWTAHSIDLDLIQRKLIRHKYFTPAEFLADISRIEENANHSRDPERQIKVSEMAAHARMHVQGFDQKWMPEFERYAERMRARKAQRVKAREAAAAEVTTSISSIQDAVIALNGVSNIKGKVKEFENGGNSQELGVTVEEGAPEADQGVNGLKRVRDDDDDDYGDRADKRVRADGINVDGTGITTDSEIRVNGDRHYVTTVPAPRPAPGIIYPPLIVPVIPTKALAESLKWKTSRLNVEQLEQLRARLLDKVWRHRTEWDRTGLVTELSAVLDKFLNEVEGGDGEEDD